MAGNFFLEAGTTTNAVTSGASISAAAASAAPAANIANATNLDEVCTAVLVAALGAYSATEGDTISLYLVPQADNTNTATVDTSTPYFSPNYLAGYFYWPLAAATSSRMTIPNIALEAYTYVAYLVNNTNETISSGWTLTFFGGRHQYT